jgi:hypothetical protein
VGDDTPDWSGSAALHVHAGAVIRVGQPAWTEESAVLRTETATTVLDDGVLLSVSWQARRGRISLGR